MADTSPQGRCAVQKALKELTDAGFYCVEVVRLPDGTLRSEAHVYDTPQVAPGAKGPAAGRPVGGPRAVPEVKEREQEPTLPGDSGSDSDSGPGPGVAARTLLQVVRPEPRLRLGEREAAALAPLVEEWLERGSSPADLAQALLPGLPSPVHSPVGVLRDRLVRKMPPVHAVAPKRYAECWECRDPVPRPGRCRACEGEGRVGTVVDARGAERARTALQAAKASRRPPGRS
ncbi:hypothetical protein ACFXDE_17610 [Kitasatospora sp. NPDC059408]|uniref:hypothetical protein n=1 Tax=Kitasatospora sp. NPDC059408 TaxID=3346823 RepID=UPI0036987C02